MNRSLNLNTKFFKIIPFVILLSFLAILQSSFFIHFSIYNAKLNLIFIAIFLFSFFSKNSELTNVNKNSLVLWVGIIGGLSLDTISAYPFGVFTLTFLLLAVLIEKAATSFSKYNIISFSLAFFVAFLFFKICVSIFVMLLTLIFERQFLIINPFRLLLIIEILYNLFVAGIFFIIILKSK